MKNLRRNFRNQAGFNLIELMIVIAIIALLIGVGIPAYRSMVNNGNETSAAQSINTIKTLQIGYASKHQGKFAPSFDELIRSAQLDERFAGENPVVNGYIFTINRRRTYRLETRILFDQRRSAGRFGFKTFLFRFDARHNQIH